MAKFVKLDAMRCRRAAKPCSSHALNPKPWTTMKLDS